MTADIFVHAARVGTALALGVLLIQGLRGDPDQGEAQLVTHETPSVELAADIASATRAPITYRDSVPPDRRTAGLLAAAAASGRPTTLVVPGQPPRLAVAPPVDPVAQRRAALTLSVWGTPGETVRLAVSDGTGRVDSLTVPVGQGGETTTRVAVEPPRAGLGRWTVSTGKDSASATTWIRPPESVRVLVLTGTPDWETRYLVRALETRGMEVVLRQELGRDQAVSSPPPDRTAPADDIVDPSDLDQYDVVVASASEAAEHDAVLSRWVVERGGGVLLLEPVASTADPTPVGRATDLIWSGPAELEPLPSLDIDLTGASLTRFDPSVEVAVATTSDGSVYVAAGSRGRGRSIRSGLTTWPWVLGGGVPEAHIAWWTSAVEWLAGGLTDDAVLMARPTQPLAPWEGRIEGLVPARLDVLSADGLTPMTAVVPTGPRGDVRFVPTEPGVYTMVPEEDQALGAAIVLPGTDRMGWAQAALEIGRAGGRILTVSQAAALGGRRVDAGPDRAPWTFLLLSLLMGAGWAVRRVRGLA